jgi:hypothetical protein
LIVDAYDISEEMKEQLCLRYDSFVNGTKRINTLGNDDEILHNKNITEENGTVRPLTINDLQLYQRLQAGSTVNEDISCDSDYMLEVMPQIGAALCERMPWVPRHERIYLVMDNAGGHGMEVAIERYKRDLLEQFKIEI